MSSMYSKLDMEDKFFADELVMENKNFADVFAMEDKVLSNELEITLLEMEDNKFNVELEDNSDGEMEDLVGTNSPTYVRVAQQENQDNEDTKNSLEVNEEARKSQFFRVDVEGLRGIAVVLVLLYHANIPLVYGGYLGVDVFYTISGYVVTRKLLRDLKSNSTIDLLDFFANRFRRLIPASVAVVFATWIASKFILGLFA